ncbi:phosphoribosylformylglycinamidine synthase,Phosphoribosylformylglycinamidine synthase,phosphoribosylformylglycinamidine synthase,Phosphoribosylformylglycinamidine (FGAM) synthase, glutamine amidotransferase domain,phosphoribosylformylglycinamidine synthase,AIR synthase related protein, C-terminal domain [[Clostridium] sordellii]|uniref:phosphoribosylformylglycinamidine synthase n=1 Tax=Paraclostridium sordellii TaxID=1505 RepID=UPI000542CCC7|nr:phosphoribosylformylglycinamidine synthase [Paeniclostridium sordellii]CEK36186.1 phosphoribosylformylglycinamidine synthase,Phosphoribosylformylglycinamidine synthase,phosphoribosylformylglycinamidine synthase,Phosphoribosylformylglycinamidine (FGAM) synthase, glutamine amidotransferase domain,phosphoribosylformylglycinamidine synthase,AIR synthase related protein, C-terminal domain [[Clostridium] sordellii] [Paeniclostridium sordellii]
MMSITNLASSVRRILVEKKQGFDLEAKHLKSDLEESLNIDTIENLRILNRYDIEKIEDEVYEKAINTVFSEPNTDDVYKEYVELSKEDRVFAIEYLPGQYDQRGDWASQCIQIINEGIRPIINTAKVVILTGKITDEQFKQIKSYCINPVDSREAILEKPETLEVDPEIPTSVDILEEFINLEQNQLKDLMKNLGLAMTFDDLFHVQKYFKQIENRNPTITEIKVLDTYWSDHCRHTTFMTKIEDIVIEESKYTNVVKEAYDLYLQSRKNVYGETNRDVCLMDIATISMKELRKIGKLEDLDVSEEINACSINIDVEIDGKKEEYLVMFKNETHNHPTEIEPFGGAATCLGGAIRDPLSGRSYVYQAMRVTGSADPRTSLEDTLEGKLMQKKITTQAANGYSSYGNQIGLSTGQVTELYDEDFVAKRMEIGAVIAAAPKENVIRETPESGDVVILLGGKTGRDGCGGATGSSKEHSEESLFTCSAEVQKGDAPNERKIQRFFRNKEVAQMIKRCNDFGAGGVCVAIGEIAESIDINLDVIPKKYEGLDGTELAISESQERMAVVIKKENIEKFISMAREENLEATYVADVTDSKRVRMFWNGKTIVDMSRDFIETNGVKQTTRVRVKAIDHIEINNRFREKHLEVAVNNVMSLKDRFVETMTDLNVCSQKGLVEKFDNTIGGNTVLLPFGGKYQATPTQGMVAKIPVLNGETDISTIMTYGYNPKIGKYSPFHGALYAVVESVCKVVTIGGNFSSIRLTLQEYFEKLGISEVKWGKPFSALLGAYYAQNKLGIPAIGGKDSMSGTFKDIDVPPTLVSFAVDTVDAKQVLSPEFKNYNSTVIMLSTKVFENKVIDFEELKKNLSKVTDLIKDEKVSSAYSIGYGGVCEAICKMSFGNKIGFRFNESIEIDESILFGASYGNIILELKDDNKEVLESLRGYNYKILGNTVKEKSIFIENEEIDIDFIYNKYCEVLEPIFPTRVESIKEKIETISFMTDTKGCKSGISLASPKVFIPTFPGTNCEYDSARVFEKAGAKTSIKVFKNLTDKDIESSIDSMVEEIKSSQIIMLPGGFSAGDEPDGSGKFIATVFRNPKIAEAVNEFLTKQDGLMLGICNGFQALIKLGLVPYGKIMDIDENCPTLTYNKIGRHQAKMVKTRISSNKSPWLYGTEVGDIHSIAISHGEGRFVADEKTLKQLIDNGQIATQYVDLEGNATYDIDFNPNGSTFAVEGITSIDGRILGKMGHSERIGNQVVKNIIGEKDQKIFESGVKYFK